MAQWNSAIEATCPVNCLDKQSSIICDGTKQTLIKKEPGLLFAIWQLCQQYRSVYKTGQVYLIEKTARQLKHMCSRVLDSTTQLKPPPPPNQLINEPVSTIYQEADALTDLLRDGSPAKVIALARTLCSKDDDGDVNLWNDSLSYDMSEWTIDRYENLQLELEKYMCNVEYVQSLGDTRVTEPTVPRTPSLTNERLEKFHLEGMSLSKNANGHMSGKVEDLDDKISIKDEDHQSVGRTKPDVSATCQEFSNHQPDRLQLHPKLAAFEWANSLFAMFRHESSVTVEEDQRDICANPEDILDEHLTRVWPKRARRMQLEDAREGLPSRKVSRLANQQRGQRCVQPNLNSWSRSNSGRSGIAESRQKIEQITSKFVCPHFSSTRVNQMDMAAAAVNPDQNCHYAVNNKPSSRLYDNPDDNVRIPHGVPLACRCHDSSYCPFEAPSCCHCTTRNHIYHHYYHHHHHHHHYHECGGGQTRCCCGDDQSNGNALCGRASASTVSHSTRRKDWMDGDEWSRGCPEPGSSTNVVKRHYSTIPSHARQSDRSADVAFPENKHTERFNSATENENDDQTVLSRLGWSRSFSYTESPVNDWQFLNPRGLTQFKQSPLFKGMNQMTRSENSLSSGLILNNKRETHSDRPGPNFFPRGFCVVYSLPDEKRPYIDWWSSSEMTLIQFKQLIYRASHKQAFGVKMRHSISNSWRYFFKCSSDEFSTGLVYHECTLDSVTLPTWRNHIWAKVETHNEAAIS